MRKYYTNLGLEILMLCGMKVCPQRWDALWYLPGFWRRGCLHFYLLLWDQQSMFTVQQVLVFPKTRRASSRNRSVHRGLIFFDCCGVLEIISELVQYLAVLSLHSSCSWTTLSFIFWSDTANTQMCDFWRFW